MQPNDTFRYDGKRVLVVGGSSGMGAAAADLVASLGAEVVVMDITDSSSSGHAFVSVDLRNQASIEAALEKVAGPIQALFSCAGIAGRSVDVVAVNFVGQRHLIGRLVEQGGLPRGATISMISSTAGLGWEEQLTVISELLDLVDFDAAMAWVKEHPEAQTYRFSKQAVCAYVAHEGYPMLRRGIRINSIQPGPTDTPLARANADTWLGTGTDYREAVGVPISTPEQQASVLAFLGSDAASYVNATNIVTDGGLTSAQMMHGFPHR